MSFVNLLKKSRCGVVAFGSTRSTGTWGSPGFMVFVLFSSVTMVHSDEYEDTSGRESAGGGSPEGGDDDVEIVESLSVDVTSESIF